MVTTKRKRRVLSSKAAANAIVIGPTRAGKGGAGSMAACLRRVTPRARK